MATLRQVMTEDPLALLSADRAAAGKAADPWASLCVLATVTAIGEPQARVLVLRDLDPGFGVFVNASSPKLSESANSNSLAVLVYLASLGVQYRLEATPTPIDGEVVSASWSLRPDIPKVMDWLYETRQPQSTPLESRGRLLQMFNEVQHSLPDSPAAPAGATGIRLEPQRIERLQLSGDQVHTRDLYERTDDHWIHRVLIP